MPESIVIIRLSRNLRYKLTYINIFETYLESERQTVVAELLRSLLQAYQLAIGPLASYLRRLDVAAQELELDEKLLDHASSRGDTESQLRFIHDGLSRAASWYKTQLADRQMAADPELRQLLVELGEIDAAKLWRTEAVMAALKIPLTLKEPDYVEPVVPSPGRDFREPQKTTEWRPRLVDDVRRPNWSGERSEPERRRGPRRSDPWSSRQPPEQSGAGGDRSPTKGGKPGDKK
jgi:hypothetical protein